MTTMPKLNLEAAGLTTQERKLAEQIVKPDGTLYASKPGKASGDAKYLWRMVAFGVSPIQKHQCLPMTADFDLEGEYQERLARGRELDQVAQRIERTVPIQERHGTMAWARVLGVV